MLTYNWSKFMFEDCAGNMWEVIFTGKKPNLKACVIRNSKDMGNYTLATGSATKSKASKLIMDIIEEEI